MQTWVAEISDLSLQGFVGTENIGIFLNEKFLVWGWVREDTERYRGNNKDSIRASSFMIQGDRKDKWKKKMNQLASRYVKQVSATVFCRGPGGQHLRLCRLYHLCRSNQLEQPGTGGP